MGASGQFFDRLNLYCFVGSLLCGAVLFWVIPKDNISEYEKRELQGLPEFGSEALFSGSYFRGVEAYYSDNFVFRLTLTKIAREIQQARGFADEGIRLFQGKPPQADLAQTGDVARGISFPDADTDATAGPIPTAVDESAQSRLTPLGTTPGGDSVPIARSSGTLGSSDGTSQATVPASSAPLSGQLSGKGPGMASEATLGLAVPQQVQKPTGPLTSSPDGATSSTVSLPPSPESRSGSGENEGAFQNINSVVVFGGRAIQIFGGSEQMVAPYAALLKKYREELPPSIKIYCMAIPVGSDFYLPKKVNRGVMREKANIDFLYSMVGGVVQTVNAYEHIGRHRDEYIQFNTDHHWTGLGAYYAYVAFSQSAQFEPLPLGRFTKREIPNFLGTLYYRTLSAELKSNPDRVEYYMIPNEAQVLYYPKGMDKGLSTRLYAEYAKGGNAYGVFLGGDYPLMRVVSGIKNSRKIVVVKDSYGNAFVPYLAAHFEEVLVVDYRYFNGSIPSLMDNFGANEILFAHNTYVLNNAYTIARERSMLAKINGGRSGS